MKLKLMRSMLFLGFCLLTTVAPAQIILNGYDQSGEICWTNDLPHAQTYDIEWSAALGEANWKSSWDGLTGIPATAATYRIQVPMCYRIVAYTNTLRSRWTVMFYLDGDNDIESDFVSKFLLLNSRNSDSNVQMVVQFARLGRDSRYGPWHSCERFYVTNGILPTQDNAVQDWGDGQGGRVVNMADPATLTAFIDWTAARYPADHYALLIGDHGFGWNGLCICWSYAKSILYLSDLRAALQTARVPIDYLMLDDCHMNMVETLAELSATSVDYVLASGTYGETDWPYGWLMEGLVEHPDWTPWNFASNVNARLHEYYLVSNTVAKITLCTADLSLAPALVTNAAWFVSGVLNTAIPLVEVKGRAQNVMEGITNTLVYRCLGPDWDDIAFGLSVYFPLKEGTQVRESFDEYTVKRALFTMTGGWRDLLNTFYDPMSHPPCHGQLFAARAAVTNYLDYGSDEHIDLYDFCRQFTNAP